MVSDIAQNFVVTGLTPSDGGGINLSIAAGYARCEGWRIVSDGETFGLTAADDTYYIYLELTLTGNKVTSVDVAEYTSEQSLTNRIYLCSVTIVSGGTDIGVVTDNRNLFAIVPSLIQIFETTGLDDWRHTSDLTKIDGAGIYTGSIPWATVIKTGSNLNEIATRSHTVLTDIGSNAHSAIDSHLSDTSNPHGSSMSVSTKVTTPRVESSGQIVVESTGLGVQLRVASGEEIDFSSGGSYVILNVETNSTTLGGIDPTDNERGILGDVNAWFSVRACVLSDVCSEIPIPKKALQTLDSIMQEEIGSKIRDEHGQHILKSEKLPGFLRERDKKMKGGKLRKGHMRNVSATISFLQGCIYELLQDKKNMEARLDAIENAS